MILDNPLFVGIDVGGVKKGFHAVALQNGVTRIWDNAQGTADSLAQWCKSLEADVIAIDSPCAWARDSGSRRCERMLAVNGERLSCFATPERQRAEGRKFYDWVRNGENLYLALLRHGYQLYSGEEDACSKKVMFETFPNAVVCALEGRVIPARQKSATRRTLLSRLGIDHRALATIDHVDAALCAVAARSFFFDDFQAFGDETEGFIVIPSPRQ
ncbi:MAG: DUF429 domain-containing protein [Candidatus Kapabacteria bacterium]|nr:DUF429 domain-containing protein [Candidatus Kapabacteria bacterium]